MCASGAVLTVLASVLAAPLAKLFVGYDGELYTLTCHAFRLFSFAFFVRGLQYLRFRRSSQRLETG